MNVDDDITKFVQFFGGQRRFREVFRGTPPPGFIGFQGIALVGDNEYLGALFNSNDWTN